MTIRTHTAIPRPHRAGRTALAASVLAMLAACGGGGGGTPDDGTSQPLAITTTNRDLVAQTTASAVMGVGSGLGAVPLSATGPDRARQAEAAALAASPRGGLLPPAVQHWVRQELQRDRGEGMKRALAVIGPTPVACTNGGNAVVTFDDADNNGDLSASDTLTMRFNACVEVPGAAVNGQLTMSITSYTALPLLRATGRMTMAGLGATTADGTVSVDGTVGFDMAELDSNTERMTITAQTPLTTTYSAGAQSTTVSLATGYQEINQTEHQVQLPGSNTLTGRNTLSFGGNLSAPVLGGQLGVATTSPLVQYDTDSYPRSGVVTVQGRGSTLRMTVQSTSQVLLELDADGNGSFEHSSVVTWAWLL